MKSWRRLQNWSRTGTEPPGIPDGIAYTERLRRRSADWQSAVSQIGNLRFFRMSERRPPADYQSAIQQTNCLRYKLRSRFKFPDWTRCC